MAKKRKRKGETEGIFKNYSCGVCSNEDAYVYNHAKYRLVNIAQNMVDSYNSERDRWLMKGSPKNIEGFLKVDEKILKWIRHTKRSLLRGIKADFELLKIRKALYRPFFKQLYYFDRIFNEEIYQIPKFIPDERIEGENKIICVTAIGNIRTFYVLMTNIIPDLHLTGDTQCFPFYTYNKDASSRRENTTDWAVEQFCSHYKNNKISKWNIFYYVYGILHHPHYRERYAANLRRELPRIPFAPDFFAFAKAGEKLADLHINYEKQDEYPLDKIENPDKPLNWRVEKMKLSKDKSGIIYNEFLTLGDIPQKAFEYRLGNRSALEWIIDQYQIKTDKRSGIVNDPNREDDEQYIVRLIGQVITVSLKTVEIVESLPELGVST